MTKHGYHFHWWYNFWKDRVKHRQIASLPGNIIKTLQCADLDHAQYHLLDPPKQRESCAWHVEVKNCILQHKDLWARELFESASNPINNDSQCWLCCRHFFFLIWIYHMQGWTATTRHGVTRKEAQKRVTGYRKFV